MHLPPKFLFRACRPALPGAVSRAQNPLSLLGLMSAISILLLGTINAQVLVYEESFDNTGSGNQSLVNWRHLYGNGGSASEPTYGTTSSQSPVISDGLSGNLNPVNGYLFDGTQTNEHNFLFHEGITPVNVVGLESISFSVRNVQDSNSPRDEDDLALALQINGANWHRTDESYGSDDGVSLDANGWANYTLSAATITSELGPAMEVDSLDDLDGLRLSGTNPQVPDIMLGPNDTITGIGFYLIQRKQIRIDEVSIMTTLPPPDPVDAVDDTVEVGVGGALAFDPSENDLFGAIPATITITATPTDGTVSFDPVRELLVYKHSGTTPGTDSFTYSISNGNSLDTADVSVSISGNLRLENHTVAVPLDPPLVPPGTLTAFDALPGLTFATPIAMTSVPGAPEALMVASLNGSVWYVPDTTAPTPTKHLVMEIDSTLANPSNGRIILSLTCYPDFAMSGNIIVNYQADLSRLPPVGDIPNLDKDGSPDDNIANELRVSRFTLSAAHLTEVLANGMSPSENSAVLATEFPFINMAEQNSIHTINDCKFGADGYLYLSFGDEGGQPDPHRNGQTITKDYYSSLLRIDVDPASTNPKPNPHYTIPAGPLSGGTFPAYTSTTQTPNFRIPADNPFIHTSLGGSWDGDVNGTDYSGSLASVRTEIWAFGLRNPFKFHLDTVDGTPTGEVEAWIGDVGYDSREEFNLMTKGANGGWSYSEGELTGIAAHASAPSGSTPQHTPLWTYTTNGGLGNSATGGIFYRGTGLSSLTDTYICGDYGSGRIWSITRAGVATELTTVRLGGNDIVDFELDHATDDILVLEHDNNGRIMRICEQATPPPNYPLTLGETGLFADLADLSPNPGVLPYTPNLRFWSDDADKSRWFVIKNLTDTIGFSVDEQWTFPEGMIWVKHFDFDLDQQNPGTNVTRLETRVFVRNNTGAYGVSYRWRPDGSEADLVENDGELFTVNFTNDLGGAESFNWNVPARAECMTCHTPDAGHALSTNTRQLNLPNTISGQTDNLLTLLDSAGYLAGYPGNPSALPRHYRPGETAVDLEDRVRSYLDVNCGYCHFAGGSTAPPSWDARAILSTASTNMLYGVPLSEGAPNATDRIIIPGNKAESSIWNKINARTAINGHFNQHSQMPPLGSNRLDLEGIALIAAWIDNHANVAPSLPTSIEVTEGTMIGTSITAALANDPDVRGAVTDQSQLSFSITGGNTEGFFALHPTTGEVTVTGWLNFEQTESHLVEVTVSDNFAPNPMTTVANVTMKVTDVANEDADGNGVPDSWESAFSISGAPAAHDQDLDGMPDFFEFLTGGDPNDAHSPGTGSVVTLDPTAPGGRTYSWRALNGLILGSDYFLEGSSGMTGWTNLTEGVDYEVVSETADGTGYQRLTIRRLAPLPARYFMRLSNT